MILAATAAFALVSATPALACPNCDQCAKHKDKVAAAEQTEKKDGEKKAVCGCAGEGKECKCGAQCQCSHCGAKKAAEKKDEKKS
jgi:hypothetical protein